MTLSISPRIKIIDSHTSGEPTRVVVEGGPDLGNGSLADRRKIFRDQFDHYRSAIINEPRGSDVLVGALLVKPVDPTCAAGVIFFNNVSVLLMCGHGTIGLVATLAYMKKITPGEHKIDTPVGVVTTWLHDDGSVTIRNVPAYRYAANVKVDVPGYGAVVGDISWGGNWFFCVKEPASKVTYENRAELDHFSMAIRHALDEQKITGAEGGEIDHVELYGSPTIEGANSKNYVLCPGGAYDRSPCGTGTSAKLACLYADGKLAEDQIWRQESIIGSYFDGYVKIIDGQIIPHIKGSAYVTAETTLIFDPRDPFQMGIRG